MSDTKVFISIDDYPIDCAVNEDHSFESDVTDHPVESGSSITDNIQSKPIQITLDGLVSDTPIGAMATQRFNSGDTGDQGQLLYKPSVDAYQRMIGIRDAREPVTIVTSLGTFDNMALVSLSVPRNAQNGEALRFKAVFKQIKIVTNLRTTVPVSVPRAAAKTSLGNKPGEENKDVTAKGNPNGASVLHRFIDWKTDGKAKQTIGAFARKVSNGGD